MKIISLLPGAGLLLCSCTKPEIYNLIQAHEKNQCYNLPRPQQSACLERNSLSYDDYKKAGKDL